MNNEALSRHLRLQKKFNRKDGGGKQHKKRTVFGSVTCEKHGVEVKGKNGKELRIGAPRTKRERFLGCPKCAAERSRLTP